MFEIFKPRQKPEPSSENQNCSENVENKSKDYEILIGENMANNNTLHTSSSQQSICHSQYSFSGSHDSSLEGSSNYKKPYTNYTSSPHLFLLMVFLATYVLLILLGASVISLFEQKAEFQIRDHILRTQHNFLAKHPCVDAESLDSFVASVIDALDSKVNLHQLNQFIKINQELNHNKPTLQSISPTPQTIDIQKQRIKFERKDESDQSKHSSLKTTNQQKKKSKEILEKSSNENNQDVFSPGFPTDYSNWEFTSSLLFVTSVVTTIGYGHISPITMEGKVFTLAFSCVTIPFTLVFLSVIVSLLKNGPVKKCEKWLFRKITKNFKNIPEFWIRLLHVIIVTLILLLLILILPALCFSYVENEWSFLDSIYYCYISLTTVGLGDFVPANTQLTEYQSLHLYRICIIAYLYGGLALLMLWIAVILRIPQMNLKPFLLTEKEEMDEHSNILDYTKQNQPNTYGTNIFPQK